MQNTNETAEPGQRINDFIQKHRKIIYISSGAVLLILILCIGVFFVMDMTGKKAISVVEDFTSRYESLRSTINETYMETDVAQLLAELEPFAKKSSGYAGGKAWSIIGSIHSAKSSWAEAETAWASAAGKSAKSYLTPLAWFNAGVAAEEQGKTAEAIDYYTKSLAAPAGFSAAPRAQFAIGRLREALNENEEAITAYRAVISGWPYEQVWTSLAHSRIIALEMN